MTKEELALVIIDQVWKKEYPDARLHLRLQSGLETACQRPFSSPVYRRQSQYRSGRPV